MCSWSSGGFLEVDLHHCQHPVSYHVLFKYPAYHINQSLNLTQGDEKTLYKNGLATVKIKVAKLQRKENVVTTTVSEIPNNSFPAKILIFHKNQGSFSRGGCSRLSELLPKRILVSSDDRSFFFRDIY